MHLRMTVANTDGDYTAKEIQVSPPCVVKEPLHVSLMDQQRLAEISCKRRTQVLLPHFSHLVIADALKQQK